MREEVINTAVYANIAALAELLDRAAKLSKQAANHSGQGELLLAISYNHQLHTVLPAADALNRAAIALFQPTTTHKVG